MVTKFSRQVTYHKTQVKFAYEWPLPTFKVTGDHSPTVDFWTKSQENIFKFVTSRLLIRLTNSLHETGLFFVDWIKKHIKFYYKFINNNNKSIKIIVVFSSHYKSRHSSLLWSKDNANAPALLGLDKRLHNLLNCLLLHCSPQLMS